MSCKSPVSRGCCHASCTAMEHDADCQSNISQPTNQSIDQSILTYDFLIILLVDLLCDRSVVCGLVPTCQSIKKLINGYKIKSSVSEWQLFDLTQINSTRYNITSVKNASGMTLIRRYTNHHLVDVAFGSRWTHRNFSISSLPSSITRLSLGDSFSPYYPAITIGLIPNTVTSLNLGEWFDQQLQPGIIPDSVKTLIFGKHYNNSERPLIIGCIPSSVTYLEFGRFYQNGGGPLVVGVIPNTVIHLKFGHYFNDKLVKDAIPSSVTHLELSEEFTNLYSKLIPGILPSSLTHLKFGRMFDLRLVRGVIPDSVTHLVFGEYFSNGGHELDINLLPDHLELLEFPLRDSRFTNDDEEMKPGVLPSSLRTLRFGRAFSNGSRPLRPGVLPSGLIELAFGEMFTNGGQPVCGANVLPSSITWLDLGGMFPRPSALPAGDGISDNSSRR